MATETFRKGFTEEGARSQGSGSCLISTLSAGFPGTSCAQAPSPLSQCCPQSLQRGSRELGSGLLPVLYHLCHEGMPPKTRPFQPCLGMFCLT